MPFIVAKSAEMVSRFSETIPKLDCVDGRSSKFSKIFLLSLFKVLNSLCPYRRPGGVARSPQRWKPPTYLQALWLARSNIFQTGEVGRVIPSAEARNFCRTGRL
jgi:hypothetical protein